LYYSYGADWRHPYFHSRDRGSSCARPPYDDPEPAYKFEKDSDMRRYIDFMHNQIRELLTNYGSIAGMWFDLISAYYWRPDLFPIEETYALIRELQPQCLISFKQGCTGTEDYMSQELEFVPLATRLKAQKASQEAIDLSDRVWQSNKDKWNEICTIMQDKGWGYMEGLAHRTADEVWSMLANAAANRCNLCLNTGPLPDGSVHHHDEQVFREVGQRIRQQGFPKPEEDKGPVLPGKTGAGAE
ncbi:alpha-L-fucosidase, partial [bacterium]|nr:alpha-L-fucosidase [bacterium]